MTLTGKAIDNYNPIQECIRCGNNWWKRGNYVPVRCPACKSQYWNKPYQRKPRRKVSKV